MTNDTAATVRSRKSADEKAFLQKAKLLCSSLTARTCPFAYFNIRPNGIVFSNSTSRKPNKVHGNRIMNYRIGELGLHFVDVKDADFFQQFCQFLEIPSSSYFCLFATKVSSILNKYSCNDLHITRDKYQRWYLVPNGTRQLTEDMCIGHRITTFHVIVMLRKWNEQVDNIGSDEFKRQLPYLELPLPVDIAMTNRVFFTNVDLTQFKDTQGNPVLQHVHPRLRLMNVDGISTVSIKEYVKKQTGKYVHVMYVWIAFHSVLMSAIRYEDDFVKVLSLRPNTMSVPLSDSVSLTDQY